MALHKFSPAILLFLSWHVFASTTLSDVKMALRIKDYAEARALLRPLADKNNDEAQYLLGSLYRSGKGGTQSYLRAYRLFAESAEQGNADAMYQLAVLYEKGLGVSRDESKAQFWLEKSAFSGHRLAGRRMLQKTDNRDSSPLFSQAASAVVNGDTRELKLLLDSGAPLESGERAQTPGLCQLAIENKRHEILRMLLDNGCSASANTTRDEALLISAIQLGDVVNAALLLKYGANPNSLSLRKDSALHIAAMRDDVATLTLLLDNGANRRARDAKGYSALDAALALNRLNAARFLHSQNTPQFLELEDWAGERANPNSLHAATQRGNIELVKDLLESGANPDALNDEGISVLAIALWQEHSGIVKLLLDLGVSKNAPAGYSSLYSWVADKSGKSAKDMMQLLRESGLSVVESDLLPVYTSLLRSEALSAADYYLGLYVEHISYRQQLALLTLAAQYGHVALFSFFPGLYSDAALRIAIEHNQTAMADKLLQRENPSVTQKSSNGLPLISEAITHGNLLLVQRLLQRGAALEQRSPNGKTPLMYAAEGGYKDIVSTLLDAGAGLGYTSLAGNTALMLAAAKGQVLVVELLLLRGADKRRRNASGKTAGEQALAAGYKSLAARLE